MSPWWAEGTWKFVANRLNSKSIIYEWGSGSSTLCLSKICKIISIENNIDWFNKLSKSLNSNINLKFIQHDGLSDKEVSDPDGYSSNSLYYNRYDFTTYVKSIDQYQLFDLIIIDGRSRPSCIKHAIPHVRNMLLIDDTWREHYQLALNLIPKEWNRVDFKSRDHFTSIWVKS